MSRRFPRAAFLASAALTLVATGCAQAAPTTVTATSFKFDPGTIEMQAGQQVKLTLRNTDTTEHDFQVDQLPVKMTATEMKHAHEMAGTAAMVSGSMDGLHVHTQAGKSNSIMFTPTKTGTYTVYCTLPGHKEAGMTATLVVR